MIPMTRTLIYSSSLLVLMFTFTGCGSTSAADQGSPTSVQSGVTSVSGNQSNTPLASDISHNAPNVDTTSVTTLSLPAVPSVTTSGTDVQNSRYFNKKLAEIHVYQYLMTLMGYDSQDERAGMSKAISEYNTETDKVLAYQASMLRTSYLPDKLDADGNPVPPLKYNSVGPPLTVAWFMKSVDVITRTKDELDAAKAKLDPSAMLTAQDAYDDAKRTYNMEANKKGVQAMLTAAGMPLGY
ncbi:MAG: hypothetical protein ACYDGX_05005 [Thermoleophilia bacterium]